jgi:hypothetical protein
LLVAPSHAQSYRACTADKSVFGCTDVPNVPGGLHTSARKQNVARPQSMTRKLLSFSWRYPWQYRMIYLSVSDCLSWHDSNAVIDVIISVQL